MIEIKNVTKTFRTKEDDVHAVNGVSLNIEDGEIFGIISYSGAGKSTLVRLINQLEKQNAGDILIDGEAIQNMKGKALREKRQKIGMIFQHFNLLWSRTVLENIELPLMGEIFVSNALLAIAVGSLLEIPLNKIKHGLESLNTEQNHMKFFHLKNLLLKYRSYYTLLHIVLK